MSPTEKIKVEREVKICGLLNHSHIVELHDFFRESEQYFLVFELVTGGELFDEIVTREHYNEQDASRCVAQILSSLQECHRKNVIHRDIKPENLILASRAKDAPVKLADFGLAVIAEPVPKFYGFAGTPGYLAPEVCFRSPYDKAVDVWSTGVVLYILLSGYPPFWHEDTQQLYEQIKGGSFDFDSIEWEGISAEAKDLVVRMLEHDASKRITVDQALSHKWIVNPGAVASTGHRRSTLEALKKFNARRKLRGGIRAVMSSNRLLNVAKFHSNDDAAQTEHTAEQLQRGDAESRHTVIEANEKLLKAVATADWQTYNLLTDDALTAIAPEAPGILLEGKQFHKFYFENATPTKAGASRMLNVKCRLIGNIAIVTYTHLIEAVSGGKVTSQRFEETRVWNQISSGNWRNVHFHRSVSTA